jgi:hypothetical protein
VVKNRQHLGADGMRCLKIPGPFPLAGKPVQRRPAIVAPELQAVERQRSAAHPR